MIYFAYSRVSWTIFQTLVLDGICKDLPVIDKYKSYFLQSARDLVVWSSLYSQEAYITPFWVKQKVNINETLVEINDNIL